MWGCCQGDSVSLRLVLWGWSVLEGGGDAGREQQWEERLAQPQCLAGEAARWGKELASRADDLSSTLKPYMVEELIPTHCP